MPIRNNPILGSQAGSTTAQVNALIAAAINEQVPTDLPFAELTGITLVGANDLSGNDQAKVHVSSNRLNLRITPTQYRRIKPTLGARNSLKIVRTNGVVLLDTAVDEFEEFDESAAQDDLVIELDDTGSMSGSEGFVVSIQLTGESGTLWDSYVDGRANADIRNKMENHVNTSVEFAGSGSDLGKGKVYVNSAASIITLRADDLAETPGYRDDLQDGAVIWFTQGSHWLYVRASSEAVESDGFDEAAVKTFTLSYAEHVGSAGIPQSGIPPIPTGSWRMEIFGTFASALGSIMAPRTVKASMLSPDGLTAGQVLGRTAKGDIGGLVDRFTIKKSVSRANSISVTQADSSTYIQFPPEGNGTSATDATKDLVITPQTSGDKVDITWISVGEHGAVDEDHASDVKVEAKVGTGEWTQIYQKDWAVAMKGSIGNPSQIIAVSHSPGVVAECRYRISFKKQANSVVEHGMRQGGMRFQIELTG